MSAIRGLSFIALLFPHPRDLLLFSGTPHSNRMNRTLVCLKMGILKPISPLEVVS